MSILSVFILTHAKWVFSCVIEAAPPIFIPLFLGEKNSSGIIISTADSFLLVPATTFIKDVYLNFINPKASEKRILFLSRLMVLTFGIIAYLVYVSFWTGIILFILYIIARILLSIFL